MRKSSVKVRGIVTSGDANVDSSLDELIYKINMALKVLEDRVKLIVDNDGKISVVKTADRVEAPISLKHENTTKPFIELIGESASNLTKNITTLTAGSITGHFKIRVNNNDVWVPYKTTPA